MKKSTKGNLFCRTNKSVLVEDFSEQIKKIFNVEEDEKVIEIANNEYNISFGKYPITKK